MICAKAYFESLKKEALERKDIYEKKRYANHAIIESWRIEVLEQVLRFCTVGLYLEDVGIALVNARLADDYNFTYERGRQLSQRLFVAVMMIPVQITCP